MNYNKYQAGVGLMEVLVALLLLAIGVLGYVALQLRAIDASSEALTKFRGYTSITTTPTAPTPSCFNPSTLCTPAQMANYDAYNAAKSAFEIGMKITMAECPGVSSAPVKRQCLYAAWDNTTITATSSAADVSQCMSSNGIYVNTARCLMMEAY